jgi:murein DD-endopeptidase MepM/ murein hydrolase activator NlpD
VITGPWTVPAAGHDTGPASHDGAAHEAFQGFLGPLAPAREPLGPHQLTFRELFEAEEAQGGPEAFDIFDEDRLLPGPYRSGLVPEARTSPVSAHPISAEYGIPGSWAAGHHTGVDFAVPSGTTVWSVGPGTVVQAEYVGDYGNAVLVLMTDGYYALYAHLSEISVEPGETVEAGTQLGLSGSTGRSTGPHLHFEIRTTPVYGSDVDPLDYLAAHGVSVV